MEKFQRKGQAFPKEKSLDGVRGCTEELSLLSRSTSTSQPWTVEVYSLSLLLGEAASVSQGQSGELACKRLAVALKVVGHGYARWWREFTRSSTGSTYRIIPFLHCKLLREWGINLWERHKKPISCISLKSKSSRPFRTPALNCSEGGYVFGDFSLQISIPFFLGFPWPSCSPLPPNWDYHKLLTFTTQGINPAWIQLLTQASSEDCPHRGPLEPPV